MSQEKKTAKMSTSGEAGEGILRRGVREVVDENRALRRNVLELKWKEMNLRTECSDSSC